jgi:hypothetical protein
MRHYTFSGTDTAGAASSNYFGLVRKYTFVSEPQQYCPPLLLSGHLPGATTSLHDLSDNGKTNISPKRYGDITPSASRERQASFQRCILFTAAAGALARKKIYFTAAHNSGDSCLALSC